MFYFDNQSTFEFWHLAYVGYILWICGLNMFFMFASIDNLSKVSKDLKSGKLGMFLAIWIATSLLLVSFAWPLLFWGPGIIFSLGAPIGASVITALFASLSLYIAYKISKEKIQFKTA